MKHYLILFTVLITVFFTQSCEKNDELSRGNISMEKDSIIVPSLDQTYKVKVITSTDFSVSSNCDWITVSKFFSEQESWIELSISENIDSINSRSGLITLVTENNSNASTLHVTQAYRSIIKLSTAYLEIPAAQQDISVLVKSNCEYDVIIPQEASDWISRLSTKATNDSKVVLSINTNTTYKRRSASIQIKNLNDGIMDSLTIVQDEGFQSLRLLLRDNPYASIFYKALVATHLSDTIIKYVDDSYPVPGYDSTYACLEQTGKAAFDFSTGYQNYDNGEYQRVVWPHERLFKYTMFVVTDSVLALNYDINSFEDLVTKAKDVYNDPIHINDDYTSPTSPLYKLISYHLLPCWLERNLLNYSDEKIVYDYKCACPDSIDMEDFYETMHPHSIMRISTPYDSKSKLNGKEIFINRKGTVTAGNLTHEGIKIWNVNESPSNNATSTLNGGYYYVDSLLLFNDATKNALRTRQRYICSTLSPDFINSNARGRIRQNAANTKAATTYACFAYKQGYYKNFNASAQTMCLVRYLDTAWDVMYHDEMIIRGDFDFSLRLPPIPESGVYEIRLSGNSMSEQKYRKTLSTAQFLFGEKEDSGNIIWNPCGSPFNMSTMIVDPKIGGVLDNDQTGTDEEKEEKIKANDKALRNQGFMKGPAGFTTGGSKVSNRLRNHDVCYRKIICEQYMETGKDYYLRIRKIDDEDTMIHLNILEIVPYSIYSGINGLEDRY